MLQVILYSLIGGAVSLVGGLLLVRNKESAKALAKYATPFAAGVLLAASFGDLLPEALESTDARPILTAVLAGMLGFFILERFLRFFHHHHEHKGAEKTPNSLIIIGDTLHNALDGIAIGAAFLIDVPTGVVASIAVALHEIPQEIGDFGLLLRNGMEKRKVVLVNVVSALATTVTAATTYAIGDSDSAFVPFLLALTAGFFIYIAASDIIPEIHESAPKSQKKQRQDIRPWLLIAGALFIMVLSPIAHDYIDTRHGHSNEELRSHAEKDHSEEHHTEEDTHAHEDEDEHQGDSHAH